MSVRLETDDPNANLEGPRGEKFRQRDGVVELPDEYEGYARRVSEPRTIFRPRRQRFTGFDRDELRRNYEEWEARRAQVAD